MVTFTEEILNEKLHFWCSGSVDQRNTNWHTRRFSERGRSKLTYMYMFDVVIQVIYYCFTCIIEIEQQVYYRIYTWYSLKIWWKSSVSLSNYCRNWFSISQNIRFNDRIRINETKYSRKDQIKFVEDSL